MKKVVLLSLAGTMILVACSRKVVPAKETGTATTPKVTENTGPAKGTATSPAVIATPDAAPNDLNLAEIGKTVYSNKCGSCHDLKNAADYTAERWEKILDEMAPKAKLSEDEKKQVAAYVNANCKK